MHNTVVSVTDAVSPSSKKQSAHLLAIALLEENTGSGVLGLKVIGYRLRFVSVLPI
jgi:hypothetical protein